MNRIGLSFRTVPVALAAFGLLAAVAPVAAQEVREVTVTAPEVVRHEEARQPSGAFTEVVSISHHVSFADLDLKKASDASVLEQRVRDAADLGCKQLRTLYPLVPDDPDCLKKATASGMEQAQAAIAAANR
jgi:UrcA family protein